VTQIRPCGDRHAIKTMAFAIEFIRDLAGPALRAVQAESASIRALLPTEVPVMAIKVSVTVAPNRQTGQSFENELEEVQFHDGGIEGKWTTLLRVTKSFVSVSFAVYDRFTDAYTRALEVFRSVMPVLLRYSPVGVIGLQYVDQFYADGPPSDFDPSLLFVNDGKVLPHRLMEARGAWRIEYSFLEPLVKEEDAHLSHMQISVADDAQGTSIEITGTHRRAVLTAAQDVTEANIASEEVAQRFSDGMRSLHRANKNMLRALLQENIRERIGLAGGQDA
jgi:uncharacterized protein (TIGR04255 family)